MSDNCRPFWIAFDTKLLHVVHSKLFCCFNIKFFLPQYVTHLDIKTSKHRRY